MALPKKGSRTITVNDIKYRWVGYAEKYYGEDFADLVIELYSNPRQKVKATFSWTQINKAYKKVNQKLRKSFDNPPPYVVRQTIIYALKNGWIPDARGGIFNLGNLDNELNFAEMKEQDLT